MVVSRAPHLVSDIDGVLCDLVREALRWFWLRYRVVVPYEIITGWEITDPIYPFLQETLADCEEHRARLGTKEQFCDEVRQLWKNPELLLHAHPYFTMWRALLEWPHYFTFATSRSTGWGLQAATSDWLALHGFDEDRCDTTHCHAEHTKLFEIENRLREYGRVVFIEDNVETAERVISALPAVQVWVVERPWTVGRAKLVEVLPETEIAKRLRGLA